MAENALDIDQKCARFIKRLRQDKDRIEDVVFDEIQKSNHFVMAQIPDAGVVDYNDNNDTIEYTNAGQAHRAYRERTPTIGNSGGQMPGRDCNGRTGLFDTQVDDVDPNACSGTCEFRFGQGFKIYTTKDYELPMSTPEVCAREYIESGPKHVAGYFRGLFKEFKSFGMDNYEANLMNLVIANGGANASVLHPNYFNVTQGGFEAPPEHPISIHFLRDYRRYQIREEGLTDDDMLEIEMPEEDWITAVLFDQKETLGDAANVTINTQLFDDAKGRLFKRKFHEYAGIRCIFNEMPVRGYFKPAGSSGGEQFYDFVRVYHWKNEANEQGGLSKEPNHDYDRTCVVCDGVTYDMVTLAFVINKKSFKRYGLGAAKKYAGAPASSQNFTMEVRDGSWIDCNDFNDKFKLVARHSFRFKCEKTELSGAIAYRHNRPAGYVIPLTTEKDVIVPKGFASAEEFEKCEAGTCDKSNCECEGQVVDSNGNCVAGGTPTTVELEPCATANVYYLGEDIDLELEVARKGGSNGSGSVNYTVTDGTAANGSEFVVANGTINWAEGEIGSKAIAILIQGANGASSDFVVTLDTPTGDIALGSCVATTVNILDPTA